MEIKYFKINDIDINHTQDNVKINLLYGALTGKYKFECCFYYGGECYLFEYLGGGYDDRDFYMGETKFFFIVGNKRIEFNKENANDRISTNDLACMIMGNIVDMINEEGEYIRRFELATAIKYIEEILNVNVGR